MASDKAVFEATMDLRQVDAALQKTRSEVDTLGNRTGNALGTLEKASGKAAKGIGALSFALGDAGKQSSGMLRGVNDLVGVMGAGGPYAIALAAAGAAVAALVKHWDDVIRKQDEALTAQFSVTDKAAALQRKALADVAALQGELTDRSLTPSQVAWNKVSREIDSVQKQIDGMRVKGKLWTDEERQALKMLEQTIGALEKKRLLAEHLAGSAGGASGARKAGGASKPAGAIGYGDPGDLQEGLAAYDAAEAERLGILARGAQAGRDIRRTEIQDWIAGEEQKRIEAAKTAAALDAQAQATAQITMQATSIGVGATQQLIDSMITGQEKALEHFASSVMRQAGSALISHGINLSGAAVVSTLTGNLPLAGAQAAGAAGLIGAGLALGGIGTGIEHSLAGGQIGKPIADKGSAPERGVNQGRAGGGRGGSGGGQVVFINNYGVYGPSAEDSAREQTRMARTARRRGIV